MRHAVHRFAGWCALAALAASATASAGDPIFVDSSATEPAGLHGTLAAHNAARAKVGVAPLFWDEKLAARAQAWADLCIDVAAPIGLLDHNANRSVGLPFYVGENIYGATGRVSGVTATQRWIGEKANYHHASNSCDAGKTCGHYTQVVWSSSVRVGCAISHCGALQFSNSVVCNYGPGGNIPGQSPY